MEGISTYQSLVEDFAENGEGRAPPWVGGVAGSSESLSGRSGGVGQSGRFQWRSSRVGASSAAVCDADEWDPM